MFDDREGWSTPEIWINGTVSQHMEILALNETATWLSLSIIIILGVILVILTVSLQVVYPKSSMQHRVECLADVLAMVAGSDELAKMVRDEGVEVMKESGVRTKLGWFRDKRGVVRWDVEWLDGPEKSTDESEDDTVSAEKPEVLTRLPLWVSRFRK